MNIFNTEFSYFDTLNCALFVLTVTVVTVLIVAIISLIVRYFGERRIYNRRASEHGIVYLASFGAIFIFLILSMALGLAGAINNINSGSEAGTAMNGIDAGTFISLITLCLSFATLVPFFVTKALTRSEIDKKVDAALREKLDEVHGEIDRQVEEAIVKSRTIDSDIARMIGFMLINNPAPDNLWSLSWLSRSIKSRMLAQKHNKMGLRRISATFLSHCQAFVRYNLLVIHGDVTTRFKGSYADYFDDYVARFETFYHSADKPDNALMIFSRFFRDFVDIEAYSKMVPETKPFDDDTEAMLSVLLFHIFEYMESRNYDKPALADNSYETSLVYYRSKEYERMCARICDDGRKCIVGHHVDEIYGALRCRFERSGHPLAEMFRHSGDEAEK